MTVLLQTRSTKALLSDHVILQVPKSRLISSYLAKILSFVRRVMGLSSYRPYTSATSSLRPSNSGMDLWCSISKTGSTIPISRICGPGALASNSGTLRLFASTSVAASEFIMRCCLILPLCLLDNDEVGDDANLSAGSISISSSKPLL